MNFINADCQTLILIECKDSLPIVSQINKYFNNLINEDFWKHLYRNITRFEPDENYRYYLMMFWKAGNWVDAAFLELFINKCSLNCSYGMSEEMVVETSQFINNFKSNLTFVDSKESVYARIEDFNFSNKYTNNFIKYYNENIDELSLNGMLSNEGLIINNIIQLQPYLDKMTSLTVHEVGLGAITTIKFVHDNIECNSVFIDPYNDMGYLVNNYRVMINLEKLSITSDETDEVGYNIILPPNLKNLYLDNLNIDFKQLENIVNLRVKILSDKVYDLPSNIKTLTVDNDDFVIDLARVHFKVL